MADIKVDGMDQLLSKLRQMGDKADAAIDIALKAAAENTASEMRNNVPVLTGQLRDSITVGDIDGTGINKTISVGFTRKGYYSKFIEFGTSKISARPFIEPSHLATRQENIEIIASILKRYLGL